jgi:hypothetical protein
VGINRSFKFYYGEVSQEFVRQWTSANLPGVKAKPSRQNVAHWISYAWSHIDQEMIRNTWCHCNYVVTPTYDNNIPNVLEKVYKLLSAVDDDSTVGESDGSSTIS